MAGDFKRGLIVTVPLAAIFAGAVYFFGPAGALGFIAFGIFTLATGVMGSIRD